jgi:delta24-sterol reductase
MHEEAVQSIADKVRGFYDAKEGFRMFHGSTGSTRTPSHQGNMIDTSGLTNILEINTEDKLARVEPNVSMERLVEMTIEHNLVPEVVPEFRGLTVGG